MILDFRDKETARLFQREAIKKLPPSIQRTAYRKLLIIHAAVSLHDLKAPPGNRLEPLKGKRSHQHSIRINDQWRICFRWEDGNAYEVEIIDYH